MAIVQKIIPNLWFSKEAEEAVNYYLSIFKNSKIVNKTFYGKAGFEIHGMPDGTVLTLEFELEGQRFIALNGGPHFKFNEAVSFIVYCDTQEEVDYYWGKLGAGGDKNAQQCGWLKDKFGLSWQVVPIELDEMFLDKDEAKRERVMTAMLKMKKLDLQKLKDAFEGE
jgi:predicted 3-demethylubiquinone-9 3-methyltransferase (glyoxalase superfamily)